MNAMEKFEEAKAKANEIMNQARAVMKEAFSECAIYLFNENKNLQSFGFHCYTPYFNDGDECIYRVCTEEPDINGTNGYEIYDNEELTQLQAKVSAMLTKFEDSDYKEMFGDHVQVTVNRDGSTDTDHYDHD